MYLPPLHHPRSYQHHTSGGGAPAVGAGAGAGAGSAGATSGQAAGAAVLTPNSATSPATTIPSPASASYPRSQDGARYDYGGDSGQEGTLPAVGDEPPKKKQKRNKPTLSCHECVERKTKVKTVHGSVLPISLLPCAATVCIHTG